METVGIKRLPVRGGEVIETFSRVKLIAALLKICREGNHAMIDDKPFAGRLMGTVLDVEKAEARRNHAGGSRS